VKKKTITDLVQMCRNQSKNTLLECMVKKFKKGFNGDYGVKLTPNKLKAHCEVECDALCVGWTLEGSLDETLVNEVYGVVVRRPGHADQFPVLNAGGMLSSDGPHV
jgi:hypothetical protein